MKHIKGFEFGDRREAAAEAKKALLEKFKPKPAVAAPSIDEVKAARTAERERVRLEREAAKEAARLAKIAAEEAQKQSAVDAEQAAVDAQRNDRKERKAQLKAEAKAKREASQALRQQRRATADYERGW